jgi:GxxExxY protein
LKGSERESDNRSLDLKSHEIEDDLSYKIIGAAIEVHRSFGGPGLLESVYEFALCHELVLQGLQIQRQVTVPVVYKGVSIKAPVYVDILVNNKVVVEVKAVEKNHPLFEAQLLTYLKLTGLKLVPNHKSSHG